MHCCESKLVSFAMNVSLYPVNQVGLQLALALLSNTARPVENANHTHLSKRADTSLVHAPRVHGHTLLALVI